MDRFFVAYDQACRKRGYSIDWFFAGGEKFELYEELTVHFSKNIAVENYFREFSLKNNLQYDVLFTHFVELCTSFFKKIKKDQKPYIIAVDHNPRPVNGFPFRKRVKNKLKGAVCASYIDRFVGVSSYTKAQILKDYGNRLANITRVIYNGIEVERYEKRTDPNFGKFIVASHLRPSKGIQDLICAVDFLPGNLKNMLQIDIYGEGPMETELKQEVRNRGLEKIISFKGSSPDLPDLFSRYSYLLQPTYMECFSLSILESLAANVPVVTTPVGGNLEIIRNNENGFIFETGNVAQLTELIKGILLNEIYITEPVDKLVEKEFNLERMVNNHIELLTEIDNK
ncbi:glycosyltransferase family 4 protein [Salegentibacter chungangensis]|uniref:Glycosyltransferase family 4 protein n=1 Tax=Salegentibacter chungangensis TaxID=1335724 RepID=A0ABW3NQT8_9FLAO